MSDVRAGESITIVGAGLVGSLAAIRLARRGLSVDLYERRPDMRKEDISAGRSINLAISARGISALADVGLDGAVLARAVPMRGRMMHARSGELTFQPYGKDGAEHINSVSRGDLNKILMTAAEATGRVRIHFGQRLAAADLDARVARFHDERTHQERDVPFARLVGTDGSGSLIRAAIAERAGAAVSQTPLSHGYKELTIPPEQAAAHGMERNALHIWPRGAYMLIALPNFDGSYTCTLFLPFEGPVSFAALTDEASVLAFFRDQLPDAAPMMPTLAHDYFANPTGQMITVKCAPWHEGDHALLIGDAAHAIVPFFGQGMNCGFEDVTRLEALLDAHETWGAAFEAYSRDRKPNADAIADMAVENFVEMRDKVGDRRFLLAKAIERVLGQRFPDAFVSRYTLVSFRRAPYRFAYDVGEIQAGILDELSQGIDSAEQVDLARAERLIAERLVPFLRDHPAESAAMG